MNDGFEPATYPYDSSALITVPTGLLYIDRYTFVLDIAYSELLHQYTLHWYTIKQAERERNLDRDEYRNLDHSRRRFKKIKGLLSKLRGEHGDVRWFTALTDVNVYPESARLYNDHSKRVCIYKFNNTNQNNVSS